MNLGFVKQNLKTLETAAYVAALLGSMSIHYFGHLIPGEVLFGMNGLIGMVLVLRADGAGAALAGAAKDFASQLPPTTPKNL